MRTSAARRTDAKLAVDGVHYGMRDMRIPVRGHCDEGACPSTAWPYKSNIYLQKKK